MKQRIIIGTCLLLTLAAVAAIDGALGMPVLSVLLVLAMTAQAQRELFDMSGLSAKGQMLLSQLVACSLFAVTWLGHEGSLALSAETIIVFILVAHMMLSLGVATVQLQKTGREEAALVHGAMLSVFAAIYVALPMSCLEMIALKNGVPFAALMVLVSKCGDMGGYLVGSQFGKHRVMPRVSPKKSWEGSTGGFLLTLAVLFSARAMDVDGLKSLSVPYLLLFGLVINVATQAGDFAESMVKRCFKVKDSADLLPTFGGALDILDSLVFAMPVAVLFTCIL